MKKLKMRILSVILLISITIIGCTNNALNDQKEEKNIEEEENYAPEYGGKITIPISPISTINPLLNKNESLYDFYRLVYEGLFEFTEDHDIENLLVDSYKFESGGRTINIKLKDNIKWHDGENFTSKDVKFTIDAFKYAARDSIYRDILDQYFSAIKPENIEHIFNVNVIDDKNMTINFDRSYSNALESLTFPIFPQHKFRNGSGGNNFDKLLSNEENYIPIGTGPYKFVDYEKMKFIELEANDEWWKGKPYINTIVGKIIEDDVAVTSFNSRGVDLAKVSGKDWDKYSDNANTKIYEYVTNNYEFLGFNFRKKIFKDENGKLIRKAIAYGIDTKNIIDKNYMGNATESDLPLLYKSWLINEDAIKYQYDPNKSKDILKKAGFVDSNKDGILETPDGEKLEFKLLTNSYNSLRTGTAEMIMNDLKEIGISIIPDYSIKDEEISSGEEIEKDWNNVVSKTKKGNFDIVLIGWEFSEIPDLSFAFHSQGIKKGNNFIRYNNPEMDQLLVDAFNAQSREEKKAKYQDIQDVLLEDLPYVGLFFRNNALLIDNRIKGDISPKSYNLYKDIYKWFIPKKLQNNLSEENDGSDKNE